MNAATVPAAPSPFATISVVSFMDMTSPIARITLDWFGQAKERLTTMRRVGEKAPPGTYTLVYYGLFFGTESAVEEILKWARGVPGFVLVASSPKLLELSGRPFIQVLPHQPAKS